MSIPSQHVLSCFMLSQVVLCAPTVHCICLQWSTCVLNGHGKMGCFFGIVPVSGGYCAGHCSNVVRMLFGSSGGMFGCTQEKCEESPNKVSSITGTRPDRHRMECRKNFWVFFFISGNKEGGRYDLLHHSRYGMTSSVLKGVISQNSLKVIHSRLALPNFLRISVLASGLLII